MKEKDSLGSSLEVGDLLPGTAYTLLLWRENRWTCLSIAMIYDDDDDDAYDADDDGCVYLGLPIPCFSGGRIGDWRCLWSQ